MSSRQIAFLKFTSCDYQALVWWYSNFCCSCSFELEIIKKSAGLFPMNLSPLKAQHSNPNPNPLTNQLWSIDCLTPPTPLLIPHRLPAFLESLMKLCYKDGVVDWCIVLVEMLPTRFEEYLSILTESLPELPENFNIVTLTLNLWPINFGLLTPLLLPHLSSSLTDSLPSLNLFCYTKLMLDSCKIVEKQSEAFHRFLWHFSSFKHNYVAYRSCKVSSRPDCIFEIHQL